MAGYVTGTRARCWALVVAALVCAVMVAAFMRSEQSFERRLTRFLIEENIGGVVVAYGTIGSPPEVLALGDATPGRRMRPGDRFRLASLSKPLTAAAVLRLVDEGRTSLDSPVAEAGPGITVRHLLQHSGGWDRHATFDPIGDPATLRRLGLSPPTRCEEVAERMPPAQFRPGTRYAYSNIGYCWLGKVIEQTSRMPYATYVEQHILAPRAASLVYNGEPSVHHPNDWSDAAYQALGPAGGWVGTASDFWSFAAGPLAADVTERPLYARSGQDYYGLGWRVWPDGTLSHFGAIPGIFAVVVRKADFVAVLLFNGRTTNDNKAFRRIRTMLEALDT